MDVKKYEGEQLQDCQIQVEQVGKWREIESRCHECYERFKGYVSKKNTMFS